MKLPRVPVGIIALALLVSVSPATAQYMYLDSNGDGVHTAADQVNPAGPTVIDIWLDTDSNRDGSTAQCNVSPGIAMRTNSYAFNLMASGGTVEYRNYINRVSEFPLQSQVVNPGDGVKYKIGFFSFSYIPAGLHRLGTLTITTLGGSPRIDFVDILPESQDFTSFGTSCPGRAGDHSYRLDGPNTQGFQGTADWFDVDGLPFGTGGSTNSVPILTQPADMVVPVGEPASQALAATDADRQPVTFSKVSGPAYVTVTTVDPGSGSAIGKVLVAPHIGDVGSATVMVSATDGIAADQKSFAVTVSSSPNHLPAFAGPGSIDVVAGTSERFLLYASDPDGQSATFSKIAGPDFAEILTLSQGPGAGSGSLRLTPTLCDAGASSVTIGVSDGISTEPKGLDVLVRSPSRANPSPPPYTIPGQTNGVAVGDFNSDEHPDVVTASGFASATVSIFLGRGDGTLQAGQSLNLVGKDPSSIAVGDLNADGHEDLAIAIAQEPRVAILIGRGDGSFDQGVTLEAIGLPQKVKLVDLNSDGILDLVVPNGFANVITLFLGTGDGTFGARNDFEAGSGPIDVGIGDFNLDGYIDLLASNFTSQPHTLSLLLGLGDGTFANRREIPFAGTPFEVVTADWNWDGKLDLAVSDFINTIVILLGDGAGGFTRIGEFGSAPSYLPQSLAAEDLNGDGNVDIVIGNPDGNTFDIGYGVGDGTFQAIRHVSAVAQAVATGDLNGDGYPDVVSANANQLTVWLNDAGGIGAAQARAFTKDGDKRLKAGAGGFRACISIEPVAESYRNAELNLGSITLRSEGTGSVSQISAIAPKAAVEKDSDRNGIPELPACFARADLARLFDQIQGKQTVTVHLEGAVLDGRRFCAQVDLLVDGGRRSLAATVSPNPFNPQATLRFSTSGAGFVRVRIFDLSGRLVRTLFDRPLMPAGDHQAIIDGRGQSGEMLASGIYFYQVEATEGTVRGRITILK